MSHYNLRLCSAILTEHFGPNVDKVARYLFAHGRSPLPIIIKGTALHPRMVRECLFILVQQNLVVHAETAEGSRMVVYYEADFEKILLRDRFPLYIKTVQGLFGQMAADIISEVLRHGKITCPTLATPSYLNTPLGSFIDTFSRLVEERFLVLTSFEDSVSLTDRIMVEESKKISEKGGGLPLSTGELKKLRAQLASQRVEYDNSVVTGAKRKVVNDYDDESNKRQASMSLDTFGDSHYYRIDYDRFNSHIRNEEIARLAEIRFNRAAGEILRQILRHGEATSRGCKDVEASEPVNRMNILKRLPTDINLLLEDSPGDKLSEYLETLSMESDQFLKKSSSAGGGTFIVPIQHVVTQIKQRIIESMITEKFGDEHKRIWRILLKKGKLEEKQVTQCAMTPKKVVCRCLYDLHNAGFVHIQDVPRTADHAAARTFYLWHVSMFHTVEFLIQNAYRSLANIKQRRGKELEARARLLEKTQRLDVLSGEAKLTEGDLRSIEKLNTVLSRLKAAEIRLDRMLLILRDS